MRFDQTYRRSAAACKYGHDGFILTFANTATMRSVSVTRRLGDIVSHRFSSLPAISASLTKASLAELLDDPMVASIEADCIIRLDPDLPDPEPHDGSNTEAASVDISARSVGSWGLDRIDQRAGQDNSCTRAHAHRD